MSSVDRLLIFGSGFIARHLAAEAAVAGIEPVVLYNRHRLADLDNVRQVPASSVNLAEFLAEERPDYIVSFQGSSFVPDNDHLVEALNTNLMMTLSLMEQVMTSAREGRIEPRKIILVGSAAEYGKCYLEPIAENFPLHPTTIYGLTKIFLYNMAMYYFEKGLPVLYTRQFNCTGPYQREVFVIPSICRQIALIEQGKQEYLSIGDTSQERDFIDVLDAARAYLTLLQAGKPGEIYNVASGRALSIQAVLDMALSQSKTPGSIQVQTNPQLFFDRNTLSNRICADVAKLSSLGFACREPLEETIRRTLEFWRENA